MQAQTPAAPSAPVINGLEVKPSPSAVYEALRNQREILGDQLSSLENQRSELNAQLQRGTVQGASRVGVENRIAAIDGRIADLEKQIAGVDAQVSSAAAIPGAIAPRVEIRSNDVPEEAFVLGGLFMIIVLFPMSIAMARRIWKRSSNAISQIPADLMARLSRIEQAVDTSAVEIERIGEGQRFITKLFSEGSKVPVLPSGKDNS
jgi:hypothetical protein